MGQSAYTCALLSVLCLAGCYGRASPTTCQAKYGGRGAKYDHCMASYHKWLEAGGEEGERVRHREAWGRAAEVVIVAATVKAARDGRLYRCTTWSNGTATCTPY